MKLTLSSTSFPSRSYKPAPFTVISDASLLASFNSLICKINKTLSVAGYRAQDKECLDQYFSYFSMKICYWYSLEVPEALLKSIKNMCGEMRKKKKKNFFNEKSILFIALKGNIVPDKRGY